MSATESPVIWFLLVQAMDDSHSRDLIERKLAAGRETALLTHSVSAEGAGVC